MALDMLGVAHVMRSGHTPLDPIDATHPSTTWLSTVAEDEIRKLRDSMPMLEDHDAHEQEMAIHGLEPTPDAELKRLKRYESACTRRKQWAYTKLMARKRSQWSSQPAPVEMPGVSPISGFPPHGGGIEGGPEPVPTGPSETPFPSEPPLPPEPTPTPAPEPESESIPEEVREFAAFADALMDPDNCDPYVVHNYLKQMELTAKAKAKLATEALAEAAAPPPSPAPPKPSELVRPAPVFQGNRRARRAAAARREDRADRPGWLGQSEAMPRNRGRRAGHRFALPQPPETRPRPGRNR